MSLYSHATAGGGNNKILHAGPITVGATAGATSTSRFLVAVLASTNLGTVDGPTNEHRALNTAPTPVTSIKLCEFSLANGAAEAGVTVSIWLLIPISSSITTGTSVQATYAAAVRASALTMWRFNRDTTQFIETFNSSVYRIDKGADPGPITIDTGQAINEEGSSFDKLWIQALGGRTDSTTVLTPDEDGTAFPAHQTTGGTPQSNVAVRGQFLSDISDWARTFDPTVVAADWISTGIALYERKAWIHPTPLQAFPLPSAPENETLIDNFNRANGDVFTGNSIWGTFSIGYPGNTSLIVVNNQISSKQDFAGGAGAYTQALFGPSWDVIIDVATTLVDGINMIFGSLIEAGTWDTVGYVVRFSGAGPDWWLGRLQGSGFSAFVQVPRSPPVAGDSVWLAKRGATLGAFHRPGGIGPWIKVAEAVAPPQYIFNTVAPLGISIGKMADRFDNFRGGTVVVPDPPPNPKLMSLL